MTFRIVLLSNIINAQTDKEDSEDHVLLNEGGNIATQTGKPLQSPLNFFPPN